MTEKFEFEFVPVHGNEPDHVLILDKHGGVYGMLFIDLFWESLTKETHNKIREGKPFKVNVELEVLE